MLDGENHRLLESITVGRGLHTLAAVPDGRFMYVTNSQSDTVSVIDTQVLAPVASVPVGKTPVALTYSSAARRMYVGGSMLRRLWRLIPRHRPVAQMSLAPGVVALAVEPQGALSLPSIKSRAACPSSIPPRTR